MEEFRTRDEIDALFRTLGLEYLKRPLVSYQPLLTIAPEATGYYRDNRREFQKLTKKYGSSLLSSALAPVFIARTENMGLGLFAAETLGRGTFIGEYTGEVRVAEDCPAPETAGGEEEGASGTGFATDYSWSFPECFDTVSLEINAARAGNELRFVNHSFRPNLVVEHTAVGGGWAVFFIAGKRIRAGEQLFADYGVEYWSGGYRELVLP